MLRPLLGLLVAACLLLQAPVAAAAEDSPVLSRIVKNGELRVGMSGDQAPLNVKSKSGEMIGMEVDLARLLAAAMRVELKIVQKPFPELLTTLKAGEVDMVMSGMTITLERNTRFAFVGPYFISGKSILTKSATLAQADESQDINAKSLTLAALAGSTSQSFVELVAPNAKLVTTQSYDEGVKLVLEDKASALVADFPICVLSLLRHPDSGLATLTVPLTVEPVGIALPPGDPLLVNLVENYLGALEGMGLLEQLREKWFVDGSWLSELP
jgi:polar amino acid transport system substrate-binding protein